MTDTELIDHAFAWTTARIAQITPDHLAAPTPCRDWTLTELLDHAFGAITMLTDVVAAVPVPAGGVTQRPASWNAEIAQLAERSRRAWAAPGVMDCEFELPIGVMPAPIVAMATALEVTTHGWDISQATGEASEIPELLAVPILAFARQALDDSNRGGNFEPDLAGGTSPSEQLISFLGREPL